jgi:hypothetical protein
MGFGDTWFKPIASKGERVYKYGIYDAASGSFIKSFTGDDAKEQAEKSLPLANPSLGGTNQFTVRRIIK